MRSQLSRLLGVLAAATVVATAAASPAAAAPGPCPGGASPCVYLPGGTYTLGNPVSQTGGAGPSTTVLLTHCNSDGTVCDDLLLNLPGITVTSSPTTVLTLTVPGEGVGLVGTTPTLFLGVPTVTPGTLAAGLTLTVSGTPFVIWDTGIQVAWLCFIVPVPPATTFLSGYAGNCSFSFTVSV